MGLRFPLSAPSTWKWTKQKRRLCKILSRDNASIKWFLDDCSMCLQQKNKTHSFLHLFRKGDVFRTRWSYLNVPCTVSQKQPRSYLLLQLLLNYCTYQRRRSQRASTKSKPEADIWFWKFSNIQTQIGITSFCNASLMFEKFPSKRNWYLSHLNKMSSETLTKD